MTIFAPLRLAFDSHERAYAFAQSADRNLKPDVTAEWYGGLVVLIDGADSWEMRRDIIAAAIAFGGCECPERLQ